MTTGQQFYAFGKLLLTAEYFVCDGAKALALPTTVGQKLEVHSRPSYSPMLHWKSYDRAGKIWFEAKFEFWHFNILETNLEQEAEFLKKILLQIRKQNSHFLRDENLITVKTQLEFPLEWGLGSSSTLIYNMAQWAYVGPFELQDKTLGGSGYDIACAQSDGPILYKKTKEGPCWELISFDPVFKENLYFIHLGKKQKTLAALGHYKEKISYLDEDIKQKTIEEVSNLTTKFQTVTSLRDFDELVREHETLISQSLGLPKVKELYFYDFWGEVKSLGAWGGDFALVTSDRSFGETREYFINKGYNIFIPFGELIRS